MAVVDDDGKLVGNVSSRDLRMIRDDAEFISRLYIPLPAFLIKMQKQFSTPETVIALSASDTVEAAVDLVNTHHIHRIYLVNEDGTPLRVVSLTDLLELIIA